MTSPALPSEPGPPSVSPEAMVSAEAVAVAEVGAAPDGERSGRRARWMLLASLPCWLGLVGTMVAVAIRGGTTMPMAAEVLQAPAALLSALGLLFAADGIGGRLDPDGRGADLSSGLARLRIVLDLGRPPRWGSWAAYLVPGLLLATLLAAGLSEFPDPGPLARLAVPILAVATLAFWTVLVVGVRRAIGPVEPQVSQAAAASDSDVDTRPRAGWVSAPDPDLPRIRIVQLDPATLAALADGDLAAASATSPVPLTPYCVAEDWRWTWRYRAGQVLEDPSSQAWVTGLVWAEDLGQVVGRAGFHGPPDAEGMVEVGYAVDPDFRRRGYATAALSTLLDRAAADPAVSVVRASISPGNLASERLAARYGFVQVGEHWDEEDGLELVYERAARPIG